MFNSKAVSTAIFVLMFAFLVQASASAQTTKVFFASPEVCLAAPRNDTTIVYQPHFTNLLGWWVEKWRLGTAQKVENHNKLFCAEEKTVEGRRIIRWPKNNSYFTLPDGRMADGRCGNDVYNLWEVPEPTPPPPIVKTPPPPPPPIVKPPVVVSPPPPPPAHVCAECLGFESWDADGEGVELDSVYSGEGFPNFKIKGVFKGQVRGQRWRINDGEEIEGEVLEVVPQNLEPGKYKIQVWAQDSDDHTVTCVVTMTVLAPPPPPPGKSWVKRHWKALVITGAAVCVVTAAVSYGTSMRIPPCGFFTKTAIGMIFGKTLVAVGTVVP